MIRQWLIGISLLLGVLEACKPAEKDVREGLKSPDPEERTRAVRAVGNSPDHAGAVRALEAVLRNDPDERVRVNAAIALGFAGPDATALLVEKVAGTDQSLRIAAVTALQASGDPSAIPALLNLFRLDRGQDDIVVQIEASRTLVKIGAPGVPQLLPALNDSSATLRRAVVEVLGEIGDPAVADRIAGLRADPDSRVRSAVDGALAKLKAPKR